MYVAVARAQQRSLNFAAPEKLVPQGRSAYILAQPAQLLSSIIIKSSRLSQSKRVFDAKSGEYTCNPCASRVSGAAGSKFSWKYLKMSRFGVPL